VNRFYIPNINPHEKYINLTDSTQLHHLKDVLRIKPKEKVAIFDGLGNEYIAAVTEIKSMGALLELKEKKQSENLGLKLSVACAIPKNVKMDDIVDKLTQLGVDCIIPIETERVIVKLDKQKKFTRLTRWEKISQSATQQSQRNRFTEIKPISNFKEAILMAKTYDLKLIPTLDGDRKTLKETFNNLTKEIKSVIVFIGPEGDFTPNEVILAKDTGFLPITLGKKVLRVDTAAIAAASFIKLNEEH